MGDTFRDHPDKDWTKDEYPVHRVCMDDFKIDKYEVAQPEFQRVTGSGPSGFSGCLRCPVEKVTWYEAKNYCQRVGKRLPAEAEREYAARERGKRINYGTGKNDISPGDANYSKSGYEKTVPAKL